MLKTWMTVLLALILTAALAACGNTGGSNEDAGSSTSPQQTAPAAEPGATVYPLTVKDATGQEFTFEKAPEKVISVSPAETEALFAIGLDTEIVGVSDYDDYPEVAKSKPKMGGITKPNEEAIIAAQPDVVFTGISMDEEAVNKLRELGITIFKTDPKSVEDVMNNITLYGTIMDRQQEAKAITDKMKADVAEVQEGVKNIGDSQRLRVYVEFSPGWTVGKGEFMDEMITLAGGENIASDTKGWNQISEEKVIAANPDVILYSKSVVDENGQTLEQMIKGRDGWNHINAIRNNRIFGLDDNLISRPGPRVTEGLKEVAKGIYPEVFK
ncbi:ABC transporter substrate-binding protein [Paenibacillus sp. P96]|uniref:ABC transporter substrate-binding protein n=1 Tax=Paenibacillus zeirhizosphaerae TaxID=2987519 RepID=A0ABT9FKQ2_9BACL|nr:ABC transporter substrate-binding protein [Paenibacillus sp. P96]MDP4095308.1 ABC transporter substrate-binding protein [Paenibacillus sp. P96]